MSEPDPTSRWTADARAYDAWFDQPWGAYASGVEHHLLLDSAPPLAGLEVCDAGCGTGRFATRLEAAGARVTAVDRDPAALSIARTRLRGDVVEGDIQRSPFPDDTFDVTFAVTVCEFTADPAATIGELIRITRPGGRVIIGSLNPNSPWGYWNRRQFHKPPWDTARFLDHDHLDRLASQHGTTRLSTGLYAPTTLPWLPRWGPGLERLGRRVAPRRAAFEVIAITRPMP
ncbi:MAG: class I SAM-dependent methyltransferase, partial [Actinomycetota bacterium]|nr:class I SAM-dependent methyltransferase [Actinomycetota bacterium]